MERDGIPRRAFVGHIGVAAFAGATAAAAVDAGDDKSAVGTADLAVAKPADLLLALAKQLDPERLDEQHLGLVRADIELNLRRSAMLSRFALTNADEPAPVFRAWRAED